MVDALRPSCSRSTQAKDREPREVTAKAFVTGAALPAVLDGYGLTPYAA